MVLRHTLLAVSLFLSGCVIPCPSVSTVATGCDGTVVDARSATPVPNAVVRISHTRRVFNEGQPPPVTQVKTVRTGNDGRFRLPPTRQYHWGYLFGVALNYRLPYPRRFTPDRPLKVEASHPDFQTSAWNASLRKIDFKAIEPVPADNFVIKMSPKPSSSSFR
ncbi:MAG: hypothetical protein RIS79_2145 [Verrucomicrobiota bacterium]|jgi:hypothetical protein